MEEILNQASSTFFILIADIVILIVSVVLIMLSETKRSTNIRIAYLTSSGLTAVSSAAGFISAFSNQDFWTLFKVILVIFSIIKLITALALIFMGESRYAAARKKEQNSRNKPDRNTTTERNIITYEAATTPENPDRITAISTTREISYSPTPHSPEEFLEKWPPNIHRTEDQEIRFNRSSYIMGNNLFDVDKISGTARCHSMSHYSEIYNVSYFYCTCRDFRYRHFPCKHMYALARATGAMPLNFDFIGIPDELKNIVSCLQPKGLKQLIRLLKEYKPSDSFIVKKTPSIKLLMDFGLITDMGESQLILDKKFTKNDLIAEIYQSNIAYKPKKSATKQEIIDNLMTNERQFAYKLYNRYVYAVYSPVVCENYNALLRKYC